MPKWGVLIPLDCSANLSEIRLCKIWKSRQHYVCGYTWTTLWSVCHEFHIVCVAKIKVQRDYCRSSQLFVMGFFRSGLPCSEHTGCCKYCLNLESCYTFFFSPQIFFKNRKHIYYSVMSWIMHLSLTVRYTINI